MSDHSSRKLALRISYLGAPFCGWQKQAGTDENLPSIQQTLETAIESIVQEKIQLIGSGRTDAGVNASGQLAHFRLQTSQVAPYGIFRGLNSRIPEAIRVLEVFPVHSEFHAQHSATHKQYSYYWLMGRVIPAHLVGRVTLQPTDFDVAKMQAAAQTLLGQHDFKAFQAAGANEKIETVREILSAEVSFVPFGVPGVWDDSGLKLLRFRVVGTGFLKQMVRSLAGTLAWIGEGRIPPEKMAQALKTRDRGLIGPTLLPDGLWLEQVNYPAELLVPENA